jgi:DNA-binding MarR family transcriptional regulator
MGTGVSTLSSSLRLLVVGFGLGLVMQVLVLAVQNSADYQDLGVATSGATLFRSIGGALGTAVFGAIFSGRLTSELAGRLPAAAAQNGRLSPAQLAKLPPAVHATYAHAFVNALHPVFLMAAGVTAVGFLLALAIPDLKLRDTVQAAGTQEHFAVPRPDDRSAEVERVLSVLADRDNRRRFYTQLLADIRAGVSPLEAWVLARIQHGEPGPADELAHRIGIDPVRVSAAVAELERQQLLNRDNGWYAVTDAGTELIDRISQARRERLAAAVAHWSPAQHDELVEIVDRLARDLHAQRPREVSSTA